MVWHLNSSDYKITLSHGLTVLGKLIQVGVKKKGEGELMETLLGKFRLYLRLLVLAVTVSKVEALE
jgi:F0F1-type ATP synthase membrane subunit a